MTGTTPGPSKAFIPSAGCCETIGTQSNPVTLIPPSENPINLYIAMSENTSCLHDLNLTVRISFHALHLLQVINFSPVVLVVYSHWLPCANLLGWFLADIIILHASPSCPVLWLPSGSHFPNKDQVARWYFQGLGRGSLFTRYFVIAIKNDLAPSGNFFRCSFESSMIQEYLGLFTPDCIYFLMITETLFIGNIGGFDQI